MSSNNGQKLLVFGLGFAQHDNRKMQQVLRHYNRMPSTPGSRAILFVELTKLGKELEQDDLRRPQVQHITHWMTNGGDFPLGEAPVPINAANQYTPTAPLYNTNHYPRPPHPTFNNINRFGPGHVLTYPEDANAGSSAIAADHEQTVPNEEVENNATQQQDEIDQLAEAAPDNMQVLNDMFSSEGEEELDDDVDRYGAFRGRFGGRGRTFDDVDEPAAVAENQTAQMAPLPARLPNHNHALDVPRLPVNQGWRGNNIHGIPGGLGHFGGMPAGRGLPMAGIGGHQGRGARPRMEHDLDDEDDDMGEFDDVWGRAAGMFARGPGRTLNDQGNDNDNAEVEDSDADSELEYDVQAELLKYPDGNDATLIECPICLNDYPSLSYPKRALVTDQCDHPDKACLECLDSSISAIVETGALHLLACPICPQKLTRRDVKEYANTKVYHRYKYLKQQASIPGHYISCTNPNCGGSQAHDSNGPSGPKMVCNFCQAETCASHRRPWHEGLTCIDYDMDPVQMERLEEEEATAKLLAKEETSICPKCGQGVTKTDGCDHMMCQCGKEWCYVCSCSYENILRIGPTAHATFCTYHPNKVNLTKAQQDAARDRIMGLVHGGEVSPELTQARDAFRKRRQEEMRPKLAEAAEARRMHQIEQKRQGSALNSQAAPKKSKVKLVPAWEEGGTTKKSL